MAFPNVTRQVRETLYRAEACGFTIRENGNMFTLSRSGDPVASLHVDNGFPRRRFRNAVIFNDMPERPKAPDRVLTTLKEFRTRLHLGHPTGAR